MKGTKNNHLRRQNIRNSSTGEKLLSLCRSTPLRICNGRKLGDLQGAFTCYKYNGQSSVDYCLVSPGLFDRVSTFSVCNFLPHLSDHCGIEVVLETNYISIASTLDYNYIPKPKKVKWDVNISVRFENVLQSEKSKCFLKNFLTCGIEPDQVSVDRST